MYFVSLWEIKLERKRKPINMKVALTGAAGHLGSNLLQVLINRGHQVKALVRSDLPGGLAVETVTGNVLDTDSLSRLMDGCDALIHCAAVISVNGDPDGIVHQTNVEGTGMVMEAALKAGIKRVIHISSIHAHQQIPERELLDETRKLVDENSFAYDRSKKAGQETALSFNRDGMEVMVMNPTAITGPYDNKPSRMGKVIIDLCSGKLPFVFSGGFDFCDSRDVANAIANGLTMGRAGENYILSGKWFSLKQIAVFISMASGKKIDPISLPIFIGTLGLPVVHLMGWIRKAEPLYTREALAAIAEGNRCISNEKAKRGLGYSVRPCEETIRDTINWFKQNGYLV